MASATRRKKKVIEKSVSSSDESAETESTTVEEESEISSTKEKSVAETSEADTSEPAESDESSEEEVKPKKKKKAVIKADSTEDTSDNEESTTSHSTPSKKVKVKREASNASSTSKLENDLVKLSSTMSLDSEDLVDVMEAIRAKKKERMKKAGKKESKKNSKENSRPPKGRDATKVTKQKIKKQPSLSEASKSTEDTSVQETVEESSTEEQNEASTTESTEKSESATEVTATTDGEKTEDDPTGSEVSPASVSTKSEDVDVKKSSHSKKKKKHRDEKIKLQTYDCYGEECFELNIKKKEEDKAASPEKEEDEDVDDEEEEEEEVKPKQKKKIELPASFGRFTEEDTITPSAASIKSPPRVTPVVSPSKTVTPKSGVNTKENVSSGKNSEEEQETPVDESDMNKTGSEAAKEEESKKVTKTSMKKKKKEKSKSTSFTSKMFGSSLLRKSGESNKKTKKSLTNMVASKLPFGKAKKAASPPKTTRKAIKNTAENAPNAKPDEQGIGDNVKDRQIDPNQIDQLETQIENIDKIDVDENLAKEMAVTLDKLEKLQEEGEVDDDIKGNALDEICKDDVGQLISAITMSVGSISRSETVEDPENASIRTPEAALSRTEKSEAGSKSQISKEDILRLLELIKSDSVTEESQRNRYSFSQSFSNSIASPVKKKAEDEPEKEDEEPNETEEEKKTVKEETDQDQEEIEEKGEEVKEKTRPNITPIVIPEEEEEPKLDSTRSVKKTLKNLALSPRSLGKFRAKKYVRFNENVDTAQETPKYDIVYEAISMIVVTASCILNQSGDEKGADSAITLMLEEELHKNKKSWFKGRDKSVPQHAAEASGIIVSGLVSGIGTIQVTDLAVNAMKSQGYKISEKVPNEEEDDIVVTMPVSELQQLDDRIELGQDLPEEEQSEPEPLELKDSSSFVLQTYDNGNGCLPCGKIADVTDDKDIVTTASTITGTSAIMKQLSPKSSEKRSSPRKKVRSPKHNINIYLSAPPPPAPVITGTGTETFEDTANSNNVREASLETFSTIEKNKSSGTGTNINEDEADVNSNLDTCNDCNQPAFDDYMSKMYYQMVEDMEKYKVYKDISGFFSLGGKSCCAAESYSISQAYSDMLQGTETIDDSKVTDLKTDEDEEGEVGDVDTRNDSTAMSYDTSEYGRESSYADSMITPDMAAGEAAKVTEAQSEKDKKPNLEGPMMVKSMSKRKQSFPKLFKGFGKKTNTAAVSQ